MAPVEQFSDLTKHTRMLNKILGSSLGASLLMTGVAAAQTTTDSVTSTTTPGIPNTGAGDLVVNVMILAISALVAIGGALYLYTTRKTAL